MSPIDRPAPACEISEHPELAAVLNPVPRLVRGEAFLLLAGTLLLFPTKWRQELFEKAMGRTRYQPMGGYRTDLRPTPGTGLCAAALAPLARPLSRFPAAPCPVRP